LKSRNVIATGSDLAVLAPLGGRARKARLVACFSARWLWPLHVLLLLLVCTSCGNALYALEVNSAASKLEEARQLGADRLAPYEYYFAKEHLDKARTEAAEADYGDAITLASTSAEFADKAIRLAREAHRGAGR
jgi:hypothetical protein